MIPDRRQQMLLIAGYALVLCSFFAMLVFAPAAFAQTTPPPGDTCCTAEQLAVIGVNSGDILQAYGWGFGVVVLMWSFGYAIGVACDVVKKT
jgi:hypothetical protein